MPELTRSEKLIIARRRLGQTQGDRADILKVSKGRYRQWEMGTTGLMHDNRCPDSDLIDLTEAEWMFIQRKRGGFTQKEVSAAMGVSDVWVRKMERGEGNLTRLQEFWNETKSD